MTYSGPMVVEMLIRLLGGSSPSVAMDLVTDQARLRARATPILEQMQRLRDENQDWEGPEEERPDLHPWDPMAAGVSSEEAAVEAAMLEERRAERLTRLWNRMARPHVQGVLAVARELGADEDDLADLEYRLQG